MQWWKLFTGLKSFEDHDAGCLMWKSLQGVTVDFFFHLPSLVSRAAPLPSLGQNLANLPLPTLEVLVCFFRQGSFYGFWFERWQMNGTGLHSLTKGCLLASGRVVFLARFYRFTVFVLEETMLFLVFLVAIFVPKKSACIIVYHYDRDVCPKGATPNLAMFR